MKKAILCLTIVLLLLLTIVSAASAHPVPGAEMIMCHQTGSGEITITFNDHAHPAHSAGHGDFGGACME